MVEQGGRGGVSDYTSCLVSALARRGIPVVLATARDHLYLPAPGVQVQTVFAYVRGHSRSARAVRRLGGGPLLNGLRFLAAVPRLMALARGRAVVHVQGWERTSLGLVATLALRATGATIVFTAHNTFERQRWALDSGRVLGRLARRTIVHARADEDRAGGEVVRIAHGHYGAVAATAPVTDPVQARLALGIAPGALVVLSFGVLRPDKGLDDLLQAAAQARPWHVLIAGEDHGALAGLASRLQSPELLGRVSVHEGFASMEAVGRFFAASDLVALPYQRASQSGVLHLAYGFARPVAVYPVGGLTEAVIPGRTGWICAQPTPDALAAVLAHAATLGRQVLHERGEDARAWSREAFDWDRIAEATETVYTDALAGRPLNRSAGAANAADRLR